MISVTVERTLLELPALVIPGYPTAGLWIPEDGLGSPAQTWRRTKATSPFMHRSVQTRAVLEDADVRLTVCVQAATTAARKTLQAEVEAAFHQALFDLTITEDGEGTVYPVVCADLTWNDFDSGMTRAHLSRAVITAPLDA